MDKVQEQVTKVLEASLATTENLVRMESETAEHFRERDGRLRQCRP